MKVILTLISIVVLAGCSGDSDVVSAKKAVGFKLIDGVSAQYERLQKHESLGYTVVCGYVNSKNIMGNYTGMHRFIYMKKNNSILLEYNGEDEAISLAFETMWDIDCK